MKFPKWKIVCSYLIIITGFAVSLFYISLLLSQGRLQNFHATNIESAYYVSQFVYAVIGTLVTTIGTLLLLGNLQILLVESGRARNTSEDNQYNSLIQGYDTLLKSKQDYVTNLCNTLNTYQNEIARLLPQKRGIAANSKYLMSYFANEEAGAIIRNIHRIFKFIDSIEDVERQTSFAKLFRSHLGQDLMTILHYNSKSALGGKQMEYIHRFNITKHMNRMNLLEMHHVCSYADLNVVDIGFLNVFAERIWMNFIERATSSADYKYLSVFRGHYGLESIRENETIIVNLNCKKGAIPDSQNYYQIGSGFEKFDFDNQVDFIISVFSLEMHRYCPAGVLVIATPIIEKSETDQNYEAKIAIRCNPGSIDERLKYEYK